MSSCLLCYHIFATGQSGLCTKVTVAYALFLSAVLWLLSNKMGATQPKFIMRMSPKSGIKQGNSSMSDRHVQKRLPVFQQHAIFRQKPFTPDFPNEIERKIKSKSRFRCSDLGIWWEKILWHFYEKIIYENLSMFKVDAVICIKSSKTNGRSRSGKKSVLNRAERRSERKSVCIYKKNSNLICMAYGKIGQLNWNLHVEIESLTHTYIGFNDPERKSWNKFFLEISQQTLSANENMYIGISAEIFPSQFSFTPRKRFFEAKEINEWEEREREEKNQSLIRHAR